MGDPVLSVQLVGLLPLQGQRGEDPQRTEGDLGRAQQGIGDAGICVDAEGDLPPPRPLTSRPPIIVEERLPKVIPEPWVPVEMAPAMAW